MDFKNLISRLCTKNNKKAAISNGFLYFPGLYRTMSWAEGDRTDNINIYNYCICLCCNFPHTPKLLNRSLYILIFFTLFHNAKARHLLNHQIKTKMLISER